MTSPTRVMFTGASVPRVDGIAKVTGSARYAYEHPVDEPLYLHPVTATIARGRIARIDSGPAEGVHHSVHVVTHETARRLADGTVPDLRVLQDEVVRYYGQFVAAVLAGSPELAREAASLVRVEYVQETHDTHLRVGHPGSYAPAKLNGGYPTNTVQGDFEQAFASAPARVDLSYETPIQFHVPMEPGSCIARWTKAGGENRVTLYDSNQGAGFVQRMLAPTLGLDPACVEVISPYVGGAFGAKTLPRPHQMLAILCAHEVPGVAVKLAMPRRQTFAGATFRPATLQRIRLGAAADGRLTALAHDVVEQTARYDEFAEQTGQGSRMLYAADTRAVTHRLVPVDMSVPGVMRAPGRAPGSFALECALDELASTLGLDPIELRLRNEPETDPATGLPFSSRELVWCYRTGAAQFGWQGLDRAARRHREKDWWIGTGIATSTYPGQVFPPSSARVVCLASDRYRVELAASDIGTGSRTILTQIAADALDVDFEHVEVELGSSALPWAMLAGGSAGTTAWSEAVLAAIAAFRDRFGSAPAAGAAMTAEPSSQPDTGRFSMHAFGAQFAEVAVHADTGEIRVRRLLGAFDTGRIVNPRTARSQLAGGMVMGLSAALFEQGVVDHRFGRVVNNDLAGYHIATHADVPTIEVIWTNQPDPAYNTVGAKGIGELGIVGVAAAIANAAWHATGVRIRRLPLAPEDFLP
jgi:xanthine dehydrogenase YagR molybdenum-binding subunit